MPTFNSFAFRMAGPPMPSQSPPQPFPEALASSGPIMQVEVHVPLVLAESLQKAASPIPAPVQGWALIDTGASISAVDSSVVSQLGINENGRAVVGTAGGRQEQFTYPPRLSFPGTLLPPIDHPKVLGCDLSGHVLFGVQNLRIIALIGRDMLRSAIFVNNGTVGSWSLSI